MKLHKRLASALVATMVLTSMPVATMANDYDSHWASEAITKWTNKNIVEGFEDGTFRPSETITKAQFAKILVELMGYNTTEGSSTYTDVAEDKWYSDYVTKISAADVMHETGSTFSPNSGITREEAAYALVNAYKLENNGTEKASFTDETAIADWALENVKTLYNAGYIKGNPDGSFNPKGTLTRAELITMIDRMNSDVVNTRGEYSNNVTGNLVVNTTGVTLKDMTIDGDLYLAEGIGEGEVKLENVTVNGRVIVEGGGVNSIRADRKCKFNSAFFVYAKHPVRIIIEGDKIDLYAAEDTVVYLTGKYDEIRVGSGAKVILDDATVDTVTINEAGKAPVIEIKSNSTVEKIVADVRATIQGNGKLVELVANATGISSSIKPDRTSGSEKPSVSNTTNNGWNSGFNDYDDDSSSSSNNQGTEITEVRVTDLVDPDNVGYTVNPEIGIFDGDTLKLVNPVNSLQEAIDLINHNIRAMQDGYTATASLNATGDGIVITVRKTTTEDPTTYNVTVTRAEGVADNIDVTIADTVGQYANGVLTLTEANKELSADEVAALLNNGNMTVVGEGNYTAKATVVSGNIVITISNATEDPTTYNVTVTRAEGVANDIDVTIADTVGQYANGVLTLTEANKELSAEGVAALLNNGNMTVAEGYTAKATANGDIIEITISVSIPGEFKVEVTGATEDVDVTKANLTIASTVGQYADGVLTLTDANKNLSAEEVAALLNDGNMTVDEGYTAKATANGDTIVITISEEKTVTVTFTGNFFKVADDDSKEATTAASITVTDSTGATVKEVTELDPTETTVEFNVENLIVGEIYTFVAKDGCEPAHEATVTHKVAETDATTPVVLDDFIFDDQSNEDVTYTVTVVKNDGYTGDVKLADGTVLNDGDEVPVKGSVSDMTFIVDDEEFECVVSDIVTDGKNGTFTLTVQAKAAFNYEVKNTTNVALPDKVTITVKVGENDSVTATVEAGKYTIGLKQALTEEAKVIVIVNNREVPARVVKEGTGENEKLVITFDYTAPAEVEIKDVYCMAYKGTEEGYEEEKITQYLNANTAHYLTIQDDEGNWVEVEVQQVGFTGKKLVCPVELEDGTRTARLQWELIENGDPVTFEAEAIVTNNTIDEIKFTKILTDVTGDLSYVVGETTSDNVTTISADLKINGETVNVVDNKVNETGKYVPLNGLETTLPADLIVTFTDGIFKDAQGNDIVREAVYTTKSDTGVKYLVDPQTGKVSYVIGDEKLAFDPTVENASVTLTDANLFGELTVIGEENIDAYEVSFDYKPVSNPTSVSIVKDGDTLKYITNSPIRLEQVRNYRVNIVNPAENPMDINNYLVAQTSLDPNDYTEDPAVKAQLEERLSANRLSGNGGYIELTMYSNKETPKVLNQNEQTEFAKVAASKIVNNGGEESEYIVEVQSIVANYNTNARVARVASDVTTPSVINAVTTPGTISVAQGEESKPTKVDGLTIPTVFLGQFTKITGDDVPYLMMAIAYKPEDPDNIITFTINVLVSADGTFKFS